MLESPPGNGNLFSAWAMIFPRGLCLVLLSSVSLLGAKAGGESTPRLTPAAAGPYQVDGNRIVDVKGHRYLVRGTELPTLTLKTADIAGDGKEFGAFSRSGDLTRSTSTASWMSKGTGTWFAGRNCPL